MSRTHRAATGKDTGQTSVPLNPSEDLQSQLLLPLPTDSRRFKGRPRFSGQTGALNHIAGHLFRRLLFSKQTRHAHTHTHTHTHAHGTHEAHTTRTNARSQGHGHAHHTVTNQPQTHTYSHIQYIRTRRYTTPQPRPSLYPLPPSAWNTPESKHAACQARAGTGTGTSELNLWCTGYSIYNALCVPHLFIGYWVTRTSFHRTVSNLHHIPFPRKAACHYLGTPCQGVASTGRAACQGFPTTGRLRAKICGLRAKISVPVLGGSMPGRLLGALRAQRGGAPCQDLWAER